MLDHVDSGSGPAFTIKLYSILCIYIYILFIIYYILYILYYIYIELLTLATMLFVRILTLLDCA